jgi:hypothetical protein
MDYLQDLRLELTAFGSLWKAKWRRASLGLNVNFSGSFFQSGHHDGFHGAGLCLALGMIDLVKLV